MSFHIPQYSIFPLFVAACSFQQQRSPVWISINFSDKYPILFPICSSRTIYPQNSPSSPLPTPQLSPPKSTQHTSYIIISSYNMILSYNSSYNFHIFPNIKSSYYHISLYYHTISIYFSQCSTHFLLLQSPPIPRGLRREALPAAPRGPGPALRGLRDAAADGGAVSTGWDHLRLQRLTMETEIYGVSGVKHHKFVCVCVCL